MKNGLSFCLVVLTTKPNIGESPHETLYIQFPTLKEIERDLFRILQATFSDVLQEMLEEFDQQIMATRDKKCYELKDKRTVTMDTMFGSITVKRNYYRDRIKEGCLQNVDTLFI